MKKTKLFRIFALLDGKQIYIGKTFSRRLSAVYHRHCRGELLATACFSQNSKKPTLHILCSEEMQAFEAYRYVLAFIHFFRNAGYEVLNCHRSIERSENIYVATQAIVDMLKTTEAEDLLADTLLKNPTEADIYSEAIMPRPEAEIADQKLTLRLTPSEKQHYMKIGDELALNQHDTLLYLLDKCNQTDPMFLDLEGDTYLRVLINAYRDEIEKLKIQNEAFAKKLTILRESAKEREVRLRESLADIAAGIYQYFDLMDNACVIPLEVEYGMYKEYENKAVYAYPEIPGFDVFRPQAVLRGCGRYSSLFILGVSKGGNCLKFRYYPRKDYLGIPIPDSHFATRDSVWLINSKIANDGAVDLIGSFPLTVRFHNP